MKAATSSAASDGTRKHISIHAAREGGDALMPDGGAVKCLFQSTPPVKAATIPIRSHNLIGGAFQSTPPVKAATSAPVCVNRQYAISIHAAREGGDYCAAPVCYQYGISIHAAREGGDPCGPVNKSKP